MSNFDVLSFSDRGWRQPVWFDSDEEGARQDQPGERGIRCQKWNTITICNTEPICWSLALVFFGQCDSKRLTLDSVYEVYSAVSSMAVKILYTELRVSLFFSFFFLSKNHGFLKYRSKKDNWLFVIYWLYYVSVYNLVPQLIPNISQLSNTQYPYVHWSR